MLPSSGWPLPLCQRSQREATPWPGAEREREKSRQLPSQVQLPGDGICPGEARNCPAWSRPRDRCWWGLPSFQQKLPVGARKGGRSGGGEGGGMGYIVGRSSSPTGRGSGSYYGESLVPPPKASQGVQAVGRRGRGGVQYADSGPRRGQGGAGKGGARANGTWIGIGGTRAEFYPAATRRRAMLGSKCFALSLLACAAVLTPLCLITSLHLPLQFLSPDPDPSFSFASFSKPISPFKATEAASKTGHREGRAHGILLGKEIQRAALATTVTDNLTQSSHSHSQSDTHTHSDTHSDTHSQEGAKQQGVRGRPAAAPVLHGQVTSKFIQRVVPRLPAVANTKCPAGVPLDAAMGVCTARYVHRRVKTVADLKGAANEHGAYSRHNQKFDETGAGVWFIEEQFYGILYIQAGLAFNNSAALHLGMKIFDWGFRQQKEDGSFDCPDVYHSAGFFLEASSRGALLLRAYAPGAVYQEWTKRAEAHIAALAAWFVRPDIEAKGWKLEANHAHRRYLLGCALGLAGLVTGNQTLVDRSRVYVYSGLLKQDPAGFNREHGGYDCSYQGIGLTYAARYYLYVADAEARANLESMARRGVAWLMMRVNLDGTLNATGNTRTGLAQEIGRSGKPKALAKNDIFSALMYWGWILGDEGAEDAAWLVETERSGRQRDARCNCHFKPSPGEFAKR